MGVSWERLLLGFVEAEVGAGKGWGWRVAGVVAVEAGVGVSGWVFPSSS